MMPFVHRLKISKLSCICLNKRCNIRMFAVVKTKFRHHYSSIAV